MFNRFVLIVIFVPLAIILIALAVANRELVAFTLDPFNPGNPALTLTLPLFIFLFLALAIGLVVGSAGDLGQARPLPQAGAPARRRKCENLRQAVNRAPRRKMRWRCPSGRPCRRRRLKRRSRFLHGVFMLTISAAEVDAALTFPGLVETLREAFRDGAVQPVRHHHTVERPDGAASTLLLMPAWTDFNAAGTSASGHIGVKIVTVSPDNNASASRR